MPELQVRAYPSAWSLMRRTHNQCLKNYDVVSLYESEN